MLRVCPENLSSVDRAADPRHKAGNDASKERSCALRDKLRRTIGTTIVLGFRFQQFTLLGEHAW
ncbi:hypothetical protein RHECIAT_CH0003182 [Rhizobium etli CIAT 652]|uniref:Uncharacterized protein n=1 Tax=Rhizobium etli (strain CIAT 652) TaxID=491916 RepID=B3PV05_RHIE6|nr:hypothetical protein RHECIAT_CH0003182 [Rhizobium etli CIAT 652]KKZ86323.1 hypothetical protein RPHASCH2410_CH17675 [Rhizobium phaseoli Ch24-10]